MLTGHFPRLMAVMRSKGDQAQASESLFNCFLEHFILNTGEGLEDVQPLPLLRNKCLSLRLMFLGRCGFFNFIKFIFFKKKLASK